MSSIHGAAALHAMRHGKGGADEISPADIGAVASVNGTLPDSSGNVYVPTGGGGSGTGAVDSVQ